MAEEETKEENALTRRTFFTPAEVSVHNAVDDCWVSVFGKVFDLTGFLKENLGMSIKPIIDFAGEDLTYWFDASTREVKMQAADEGDAPYFPHGEFIHAIRPEGTTPWWTDAQLMIGTLSPHPRRIRICNTLTSKEVTIEVAPPEETLAQIRDRFKKINCHCESYTWKFLDHGEFRPLDMDLTLSQNGIMDEREALEKLEIDEDEFLPVIHLAFNDDLTEA